MRRTERLGGLILKDVSKESIWNNSNIMKNHSLLFLLPRESIENPYGCVRSCISSRRHNCVKQMRVEAASL